jgi:hypothetical protein
MVSLDVKSGSQIRRVSSTLGFQFRFSLWHISAQWLRAAHIRMTRCGFVFTANCQIPTLWHFSETAVSRTWHFAVKVSSELPQCKEELSFYVGILLLKIYISVVDLDPDQFGSWSLLVRSGFSKELWKFVVRFSASESNWNRVVAKSPDLRAWFYIYGCPTQRTV